MTNLKEQSNNANVNANELAETVSASLDKSQKNATNTEQSVRQVISMTGEDLHKDTVTAILNDQSIGIEKKIELVHSENADYDSRLGNNTSRVEQLQSTQTRNVGAIIKWCSSRKGQSASCLNNTTATSESFSRCRRFLPCPSVNL